MGTNFYIKGYSTSRQDVTEISIKKWHIGKRSGAGQFCFDCGVSLALGGNRFVHYDVQDYIRQRFPSLTGKYELEAYHKCPLCEKPATGGDEGKTGVHYACSFTFAMGLAEAKRRIEEECLKLTDPCVQDEYYREYTWQEFMDILDNIPHSLWFTDSLGTEFS